MPKIIPYKLPWGAYLEFPTSLTKIQPGKGSPLSVVNGRIGDLYLQTDAADEDHILWINTTGTFSSPNKTGWVNIPNSNIVVSSLQLTGSGTLGGSVNGYAIHVEKVIVIPLNAVATNGGIFSWANPEGLPIMVTGFWMDVTTNNGAGWHADVGFGTSATGDYTQIMSDVAIASATQYIAASSPLKLKVPSADFVTGTDTGNGDTMTGLVGNAYLKYFLMPS